jgi:hypothetical protein
MKKMLFAILMVVMLTFSVSAMATQPEPVVISGQVNQNSGAVVTTPGFGTYNGANASFGQESAANYTASGNHLSGAAEVNGSGQITATFDNDGRRITSSAEGSIKNDASATATGMHRIDADIAGNGAIATNTIASMGLNGAGQLGTNGAFGQTSSLATFNYVLDPTESISGKGAATGSGSTTVNNLAHGDTLGYSVSTSACSSASGSVNPNAPPTTCEGRGCGGR